jgi:ubiquinone/menaquinone biosynthesis C-methylase UbiE
MDQVFLNPVQILKQLNLTKDMTAVDLVCGSGGWVLPLAKTLELGKVYAIDLLPAPLSALQSKARGQNLLNIETKVADIEKRINLPPASCDIVLMSNILFECEDKQGVLAEVQRILRKEGQILIVDWEKDAPLGPKEERASKEEIKQISQGLGLKITKEFKASAYHYGLVLVK